MGVINRVPAAYVKMTLTFTTFSGQERQHKVTVPFAKTPTKMDINIRARAIVRDIDSKATNIRVAAEILL